ncbi:MAG: hypothetical protein KBH78_13265 [Candidatus Hydrogenedentes bacterium]|nr:hypothetical protein [Candidatus Hydrogenedentota bacterium]
MKHCFPWLFIAVFLAAGLPRAVDAWAQDAPSATPDADSARKDGTGNQAASASTAPPNFKSQIPRMPEDFPWAGDPRPYADSRWAPHIDRALWFVLNDRTSPRWTLIAILDFLRRRFGLHERYSAATQLAPDLGVTITPVEQERYYRLTEPGFRFKGSLPEKLDTMDDFMTAALYCDVMPIPQDTLAQMLAKLREVDALPHETRIGPFKMVVDYFYPHLALALQWMREKNCVTDLAAANELREGLIRSLEGLVSRNGPDTDLGMEAMAMLGYLRVPGRVKPAWVEKMVAAQLPDGGWANAIDPALPELTSNGHSTVLALWVLLEQAVPKINDVPWVAPAEISSPTPAKP